MAADMAEQWKTVPGYEGRYEVSDLGRVRSLRFRNRTADRPRTMPLVLSPWKDSFGYDMVGLGARSLSSKPVRIHALVLSAFVGPRPEGQECLHQNGDAGDNRLVNLRWGTHAENCQDMARHGSKKGEHQWNAKLSNSQIQEIRAASTGCGFALDLAKRFGVVPSLIYQVRRGEIWKHLLPVMESV